MNGALAPADEAGIVAAIVAAHDGGTPLEVCGNGSKRGLLRPVHQFGVLGSHNKKSSTPQVKGERGRTVRAKRFELPTF